MDTKINIYILSTFLEVHNFLIILTVMSAASVLAKWRNLHLKSIIYRRHIKKATPCWLGGTTSDVISLAHRHHEY